MKGFQFDEKLRFEKVSASFMDKDSRSNRSPTGREQIIHQHNPLAGSYGIDVHLHFRFAILMGIPRDLRLVWKLAAFSDRDKSDTKFIGDCRSKNKPARVDPNNLVNLYSTAALQKKINRRTKQDGVV